MSKKAFEIQFNWIFVLVAGAIILLFFTLIVVKQKSVSETSTKATILKGIEAIIIGASVTQDTTKIENIPSANIEIGCGRVSIDGVSKQYQNLILFAPGLLKGDKLAWQTTAFSAPYRATNLLYMTSPNVRYIIIGNNNLVKEINKSLPFDLKVEFYQNYQNIQIKDLNNYKVRFIVFGDMIDFPQELKRMPDFDVTAININPNAQKGAINFYEKKENSWTLKGTSSYIGQSSIVGAVYTDTLETYHCNMQNAFLRLALVTRIQTDRLEKLKNIISSRNNCAEIYSAALPLLKSISSFSSKLAESSKLEISDINSLADASKKLSDINKEAQKYSCTLIY